MNRREFLVESAVVAVASMVSPLQMSAANEKRIPDKVVERVLRLDKPNCNKRIYTTELAKKIIKDNRENMDNGRLLGEYPMAQSSKIELSKVSHKINDLYILDGYLMAEIEILDTPQGNKLRNLLAEGEAVFRACGQDKGGKFNEDGNYIVSENYKLIAFHATLNNGCEL